MTRRQIDGVRAVLALGVLLVIAAAASWAAFTDRSFVQSNVGSGRIDLALNGNDGSPTAVQFVAWNATAMAPGQAVYGPLTVQNRGSVPLIYTMTAPTLSPDSSTPVAQALVAGIRVTAACNAAGFAAASVVTADRSLATLAISSPRLLAASASEALCFKALLPMNAPAAAQGGSVAVSFTFTGTTP